MTVREALAEAARRLAVTSDTPRLDAELLMAHALGVSREAMLLSMPSEAEPQAFGGLVERRLAHEPVAYIIGRRAFWTVELAVGPGVLIPRPESETLIEAAVEHFGEAAPRRVLDLGTGSGALLLAALDHWPQSTGDGRDACAAAIEAAVENARLLGLADRAQFSLGDWGADLGGRYDLILCNPPYVETGADLPPDVTLWEPAQALFAGADGLDAFRRLAPQVPALLAPDGVACFEIGAGQAEAAGALFAARGLRVSLRKDLSGHDRCLVLRH